MVFLVTDEVKFGFSFLASCLNLFIVFNPWWCLFVFIKRVLREAISLVKGRSSLRRVLQMQLLISCLQLDVILTSRLEIFLQELQRGWKQESVTCSWSFSGCRELSGYKRMLLCERKFAKSEKPVSRIVSVMLTLCLFLLFFPSNHRALYPFFLQFGNCSSTCCLELKQFNIWSISCQNKIPIRRGEE